jgi:hypothetical protein
MLGRTLAAGATGVGVAVLLAITLWGVVGVGRGLGPSLAAAAGNGTTGSFTAEHMYDSGRVGGRVWRGRFISDDGSITRNGVELVGPPSDMTLGRTVPALDTGDDRQVYTTSRGSVVLSLLNDWFAIVFAAAVWIGLVWLLVVRVRERLRPAGQAPHADG